MIKLKKSSLQDFQKLTSTMAKNTTLPILGSLKLELVGRNNQLTKSNLATTCTANIEGATDAPYEPMLLDEATLFGFLNEIDADDVHIHLVGNKIMLGDGRTEIGLPIEDFTNYPKVPSGSNGAIDLLTKEHIEAIKIAKTFVNDNESTGSLQFIHITDEYIAAFNHHHFYVNNRFRNLPSMYLNKEQADIITGADQDLYFEEKGNHYFFTSNCMQYILTKRENGSSPKISIMAERLRLPGKEFTILRNDLVSFCRIANITAKTPVSNCNIRKEGNKAILSLLDADYDRDGRREVQITGDLDSFNFNARINIDTFRVIPREILECKTLQNNLIITGEAEWFCFTGMAQTN